MNNNKPKAIQFRLIFDPEFYEKLKGAAKREQMSIAAFLRSAAVARIREIEASQQPTNA